VIGAYVPFTYHVRTVHVPRTFRSCITYVLFTYRIRTVHVPRTFCSRTAYIPFTYHIRSIHVPHTYCSRTAYIPFMYHLRTVHVPRAYNLFCRNCFIMFPTKIAYCVLIVFKYFILLITTLRFTVFLILLSIAFLYYCK